MVGQYDTLKPTRSIRVQILGIAWLPSLTLLLVGLLVAGSLGWQGWRTHQDVERLGLVTGPTTDLLLPMDAERRATILFLARPNSDPTALLATRPKVDDSIASFAKSTADNPLIDEPEAKQVLAGLPPRLDQLRRAVDARSIGAVEAWQFFVQIHDGFMAVLERTSAGQPTATAAVARQAAALMVRSSQNFLAADTFAQAAYVGGGLSPAEYALFAQNLGTLRSRLAQLPPVLPPDRQQGLRRIMEKPEFIKLIQTYDRLALAGPTERGGRPIGAPPLDLRSWNAAFDQIWISTNQLSLVQVQYAGRLSSDVANDQIRRAAIIGTLLLMLAAGIFLATHRASSHLVGRLRRLAAETVAHSRERLPGIVTRLRDGQPVDVSTELPRLQFGDDEIGEVARAFDEAQRAATEAAVREAELRTGLRTVFLDIARRSQAIVHRQLAVLDQAEKTEEDPDHLARLFQLDHLATRARRNAENLVILGGGQAGRQWRNPVPLIQVIRSAISESEDYVRVTMGEVPDAMVKGVAVGDVTHLLAELVDNATRFSPPTSQVELRGSFVGRGIALELTDRGLGFVPEELDRCNQMLHQTPDFHTMALAEEPRLGLFVVGRLASRHGIAVTLTPSPAYGGTCVVILLPYSVLSDRSDPEASSPVVSSAASSAEFDGLPVDVGQGGPAGPSTGPITVPPTGTRAGLTGVPTTVPPAPGVSFAEFDRNPLPPLVAPPAGPISGPISGPIVGSLDAVMVAPELFVTGPATGDADETGEVSLFDAPPRPYRSGTADTVVPRPSLYPEPEGSSSFGGGYAELQAGPEPEPEFDLSDSGDRPSLPRRTRQAHLSPMLRDLPGAARGGSSGSGRS